MSDNTKTVTFVGLALLLLLVAWISRPDLRSAPSESSAGEMVGKMLVTEFDPLKATSLEILTYDPDSASVRRFVVKQVKGLWSIPSHDNYPADAESHLAEAATDLLGRKILSVASPDPGDHETYGVVEPDADNPRPGMGVRVTMKDANDKPLLALVVGKEVPDRPELHYVRSVGQDPVYTAAIKTDKLTTKFEDWIERDLLKLKGKEVKQVEIRDYAVVGERLDQRSRMTLEDSGAGDPPWKLAKDEVFKPGGWQPLKMAADEELNATKLDDLKFALDELKIVDVRPKPKGLSADLKAGKGFANSQQAVASLEVCGFYFADAGEGPQLYSNDGEVRILREDGVQYVLRFGQVAGGGEKKSNKAKKENKSKPKNKEGEAEDSEGTGLSRFIFVTTEFNQDAIPKPELEPLPKEEPAAKPDAAKPKTEKPGADKAAETKAEENKAHLKAERERIEKENQRKQDLYKEKIDEGKKQVKALNARFADWYYIIPDNVYRKIHLGHGDVVKKKEKEKKEAKENAHEQGEMPGEHEGHGHTPDEHVGQGNMPEDFERLKENAPKPDQPAAKPDQSPLEPGEPPAAKDGKSL